MIFTGSDVPANGVYKTTRLTRAASGALISPPFTFRFIVCYVSKLLNKD
jgi:hypothetical protein